jgi:hypothetical protein
MSDVDDYRVGQDARGEASKEDDGSCGGGAHGGASSRLMQGYMCEGVRMEAEREVRV